MKDEAPLLFIRSLTTLSPPSILVQKTAIQSQRQAHVERVRAAFLLIDTDHSGELDATEIIKGIHRNSDVRSILLLPEDSEISASEYDELFKRIDVDDSSGVSYEEVRVGHTFERCIDVAFLTPNIKFEVFVDTIFSEERQRKLDDARQKREEEEEKLRQDHKLGLKRAEDRLMAAEESLTIIKDKFKESLGEMEVEER